MSGTASGGVYERQFNNRSRFRPTHRRACGHPQHYEHIMCSPASHSPSSSGIVPTMPTTSQQRHGPSAYAGLDFIKAAFCPLDFNAQELKDHPSYAHLGKDKALGELEVSDPLHYPRQFPYTDASGNRKTGTQIVTAQFGLAPKDFDLFLGIYTYLKRLPELPADGRSFLTVDFLAKQLNLPADGQASYQRIRSRIFRFSYVKYTNTAFWNPESKSYDIVNFGFWNLAAMSRMTESRRPIEFEWDPTLLRIVRDGKLLTFDYDLYLTLSPAMRRFYLIANRDGWNQRDSSLFLADEFTIHQIGYSERPEFQKQRLQKLKRLLDEAEKLQMIRPYHPWKNYLHTLTAGPHAGRLALRWTRGPLLRTKNNRTIAGHFTDRVENDALYAQVCELRDEKGRRLTVPAYRRLVSKFGRDMMQRHINVVLAQKENRPASFRTSEVAAFINRLQRDHPEPDWYQDLKRAERLAPFTKITPSQLSLDAYGTFFRE